MSEAAFRYRTIPTVNKSVLRLGLAPNYGLDAKGVEAALEAGIRFVYWTPRMGKATGPLKAALARDRDAFVVATGPTTGWWGGNVASFVDSARAELGIDQLDILQLHWVGVTSALTDSTIGALVAAREAGKTRAIGVSIHDRERAGRLAADSPLDHLMIRYNAAHPGAERDIFPHLRAERPRSVCAYTATRWGKLLKPQKGWSGPVPTAGDCYRFCLSSPHVDVVLTGPANPAELRQNLDALDKGPLSEDEQRWMRDFGKVVHG